MGKHLLCGWVWWTLMKWSSSSWVGCRRGEVLRPRLAMMEREIVGEVLLPLLCGHGLV